MRVKLWATLLTASSILVLNTGTRANETDTSLTGKRQLQTHRLRAMHIEIAGADDSDRATRKQLEDAGTNMVPDEGLKKAKPMMQPSAEKLTPPPAEKKADEEPTPEIMPVADEQPEKQPMAEEAPMPDANQETPMQTASPMAGPYLRLDAGYAFNQDSDGTQSAGAMTSESIDGATVWGGGIGYRFDENMRGDITFSYRPDADVSATTAGGNIASTEVSALSVMLNAYWDIMTVDQLTPYVGAGIGMAHLSTSDQTTTGGIATETGSTADNLAWSLTAGAAYQILDNTALDMNYRFINLGDFGQQGSTSYDALVSHEVRAGLRISF